MSQSIASTSTTSATATNASASSSNSEVKICVVTGGNSGIGFAICKQLSECKDTFVILTARDEKKGKEAVEALNKLGRKNVDFVQLDVTSEKSVAAAAEAIKKKYTGVDILHCNAGIAWSGDDFDAKVAETTMNTNYFGVIRTFKAFLPILRKGARVVNMASIAGPWALGKMRKDLQDKFLDDNLTEKRLTELIQKFIDDVTKGTWEKEGWAKNCYGTSKVGVMVITKIWAKQYKDFLINSVHPGYVQTNMTKNKSNVPLTPDEGAYTPVWLSVSPDVKQSGALWDRKRPIPFLTRLNFSS
eukprot:TRINITY_DN3315_c0_g1_i1.p1 TRINITY_DN3315_c0_g1~~TRINITY_DN3315_c0_g1_i1.p1  ORF type:complete len:301 (-),score=59.23 TRINITY_DN3315_c0_g1_i1:253-1155(-)